MDAPTFNALYFVYHIHHAGYQYSRPCVGAQRAGSPEWPGSAPALQTATLHREHTVLRFNCSSGPKGTKASPLPPVCAHLIEQTTVCASDLHFPSETTPIAAFWGVIRVSELGGWMIEYWNCLQRSTCIFKSILFIYFLKASFFKFKNTSLLKNVSHHLTMQSFHKPSICKKCISDKEQ